MKRRLFSTFTALLMVFSLVMYLPNVFIKDLNAKAIAQSEFSDNLNILRATYPNYSTWNGSFDGGSQCWGFARLVAYNVFGSHVSSWTQVNSISNVKAGDVVQYGNTRTGHTIFVTGVSGDTITFVDCNGNGNYSGGSKVRSCGIKWDNTVNKSAALFGKPFSYLFSSPQIDENTNQNPIGYVDEIEGWNGKIHIRGWAFDPDDSSESLQIHVYIGGPAGSGAEDHVGIIANKESSDVNNAYGIAGSHRFDAWINTNTRGDQPVYIYAINNEGGHNPDIGSGNAYISTSLPDDFHAMIVHSGSNKPIMQNDSGNVVLTSESRTNYDATLWHIMANGDGSYAIYSHKNGSRHGKALTVNGYSDSDGTKLICYTNSSNNGQKFKIISRSSDETLKLVPLSSKSSDRCLELANGSTSDGTPVQIRTANGTAPQKFIFKILDANKNKIDYKLSADKTSVEKGTPVTITVGGTTPYVVDYEFHIIDPDGKETVVDKGCNPVYTLQTEKPEIIRSMLY